MTFDTIDSKEKQSSTDVLLEKKVSQETTKALDDHKEDVVKMAGVVGVALLADSFSESKSTVEEWQSGENLSWKEKLKKQFSAPEKKSEISQKSQNNSNETLKESSQIVSENIVSHKSQEKIFSKEVINKNFDAVKSSGILYQNGCTMCSRTAWLDAKNIFGVDLPLWNARDSFNNPIVDKKFVWTSKNFDQSMGNFADVLVEPPKMRFSEYGHRMIAFRNQEDGQRYGIDPYVQQGQVKPFLIKDYFWKDRIAKVNYYDAPVEVG